MKTLFPNNFNWPVYLFIGVIVRLFFPDLTWFSYLALMLSFYQFALLFDSIGYVIPTRHLLGSFMCIQFFMGPFFAYNGLDKYQYFIYKMKIPEEDYFQYSIPAIALFILGLHVNSGNYKGEKINIKEIEKFVHKNPTLPYYFIG